MSEPQEPEFRDQLLRGARFIHDGLDVDAWAETDPDFTITVSGINVWPYVDAELNRLLAGRETRTAGTGPALLEA